MKFFHSLEFKILSISLSVVLLANVFLTVIAINFSTAANEFAVKQLVDAVSDSAAGKIKGETEKQLRTISCACRFYTFTRRFPQGKMFTTDRNCKSQQRIRKHQFL